MFKIRAAVRRLLVFSLFGCFFVLPAYGQEGQFQYDPIEHYTSRFLITILLLGIGVTAFSLLRYRGRITGTASWMFLLTGIVVIPSVSVLLGTLLALERAERVEFCGSCHLTMKTYVDDLKNPDSTSLAAVHYQNRYIPVNQCYSCHTGYGMFGTVEAKMSGLIDVYKYYTRTFHIPIKMRAPYPNNDCLKCHGEAVLFLAVHDEFNEAIFAGKMTCMECHARKNPAHTLVQPLASR